MDDDVAERLQAEVSRTGLPFRVVINERLRIALAQSVVVQQRKPFIIEPRAMGGPATEISYDNVGTLLAEIEGVRHG